VKSTGSGEDKVQPSSQSTVKSIGFGHILSSILPIVKIPRTNAGPRQAATKNDNAVRLGVLHSLQTELA